MSDMARSQTYAVSVALSYRYGSPAAQSRHMLRVTPAAIAGTQRMIAGHLFVDPPPDGRRDLRDFWGTTVQDLAYAAPLTEVTFRWSGRVTRTARPATLDLSPPIEHLTTEVGEVRALDATAPHHYLGASERVRPESDITAFARDAVGAGLDQGQPVMAVVAQLGTAFHDALTFDPDATQVDTEPLVAFRARRGVCQDYSHIMIAGLRGLGIPAGYVSGLLRTTPPPGQPRLEGADAMHAWVMAWCGTEIGWVQFDPTNDCFVDLEHIIIGFGRDYADVAPIRGALRAAGGHTGRQAVDVVPVA